MGNDDNSAKRWIKLNRGRLNRFTASRCREWDDARVLFSPAFSVLRRVLYSAFWSFLYVLLHDRQ